MKKTLLFVAGLFLYVFAFGQVTHNSAKSELVKAGEEVSGLIMPKSEKAGGDVFWSTTFDWEDAAIGPAVLDLLNFIQNSSWHFGQLPLPPEEIITHYRTRLAQTGNHVFTDDNWAQMWDNALMWTFVTGWINVLSRVPDALLTTRLTALETALFQPVKAAVARRLS